MVRGECIMQLDGAFDFDHDDHDVEAVLFAARAFVKASAIRSACRHGAYLDCSRRAHAGSRAQAGRVRPARGALPVLAPPISRRRPKASSPSMTGEIAVAQFIETCHATMLADAVHLAHRRRTNASPMSSALPRTFLRAAKVR